MAQRRRELATARKAVGLTQERLAEALRVDVSTVQRWEAGTTRPWPYLWPKLANLLSVSKERLQELLADETPDQPTSTTSGVPGDFPYRISVATPVPTRIGWSDVEHVRSTTRAVATAENVFGGGLSAEAPMAQLRWAAKLVKARATDDVRRAMVEAIGNLSSVVAYSAFDVHDHVAADQCFNFALWCSDQSASWSLRANTLAEISRKSAYLGDLDNALSTVEFAQVRSDRLTPTARAMLATLRARLLALTDRHAEARAEVARADASFADGTGVQNPPWLTYYDRAEHKGSTGKALIPIACAEHNPEVAAPRLREAVATHLNAYPRSRAFSRTRLAKLTMETGDPHEAVDIGRRLLDEVAPLRSQRIIRELHGLVQATRRHERIREVTELRHDLLALTPAKADP